MGLWSCVCLLMALEMISIQLWIKMISLYIHGSRTTVSETSQLLKRLQTAWKYLVIAIATVCSFNLPLFLTNKCRYQIPGEWTCRSKREGNGMSLPLTKKTIVARTAYLSSFTSAKKQVVILSCHLQIFFSLAFILEINGWHNSNGWGNAALPLSLFCQLSQCCVIGRAFFICHTSSATHQAYFFIFFLFHFCIWYQY